MFGTIARVTVQPGKDEEFLAIGAQWTRERGAATGQVAEYVFKAEGRPGEYFLVGVFRDRDTYYTNARDPETDRWYRRMRATLAADPEWHDGEVTHEAIPGGI
ncbi:MAG TPA: antibiotic biosynthesis monooxygenase [Thermomicrobiales bacterium]|nr:antibiotic biosynthesis monooxygenase [Thermomicrobiales bacterium]